jgi:hypothetical protein
MFETLLVWRNHVVPLAEDPGVTTGAALGQFPAGLFDVPAGLSTASPLKMKGPAVPGRAFHLIGGANRDRTDDLYNAIVEERGTRHFVRLR